MADEWFNTPQAATHQPKMHSRMETLLGYLNSGLYGKDEAVRLSLLAAVAGENVFLLGHTGAARSMISGRIERAFRGADGKKCPVCVMDECSTADDVRGIISGGKLNGDVYAQEAAGDLGMPHIAFFHELWHSTPAALNALLSSLDEREADYSAEGGKPPLILLIAASYGLPQKGQWLDALYDKFALRVRVNPVWSDSFDSNTALCYLPTNDLQATHGPTPQATAADRGCECLDYAQQPPAGMCREAVSTETACQEQGEKLFRTFITAPRSEQLVEMATEQEDAVITFDELYEWREAIDKVEVGEEILDIIAAIRKETFARNKRYDTEEARKKKAREEEQKEKEYKKAYKECLRYKEIKAEDYPDGEHYAVKEEDASAFYDLYCVSGIRWKRIVHILRTSAFLNGREAVDMTDIPLIEYCLWSTESQQKEVHKIIHSALPKALVDNETSFALIDKDIDAFKEKVDETWFENKARPVVVKVNNEDCYECIRNGKTWYIGVMATEELQSGITYSNGYGYHNIYDAKRHYSVEVVGERSQQHFRCDLGLFLVKQMLPPKPFAPKTHQMLQNSFDAQYYATLADKIDKAIAAVKKRLEACVAVFKNNLFTVRGCTNLVLDMQAGITELESKKAMLNEQHKRYYKNSSEGTLNIGDVVTTYDGTMYTLSELKAFYHRSNCSGEAPAVICATSSDEVYALGVYKRFAWKEAKDFVRWFEQDVQQSMWHITSRYAAGWKVPDIDLLKAIYGNREAINKTLKTMNMLPLAAGKYWSSSQKDSGTAYCVDFDNGGEVCAEPMSKKLLVCLVHTVDAV